MGLAAAALCAFAGCSQIEIESAQQDVVKAGQPFEITASSADTKTTGDGLNIVWAEGDALTVFHAEAGSTAYGSNDQFTLKEESTFSGTLTEALADGADYDWYAIYPYSQFYTTPANTSTYTNISKSQTQAGYGSTTHLAGKYFPLYGKAASVASDATPSITMKQVCAVIEIEVTNNSGEDLTINSASVTSTKVNLAGGYYINFAGSEAVIVDENEGDSSKDSYMSKTVTLSVTGGTALANGEKAVLYMGVRPFTANDETLTIAVNGYEKDLVIPAKDVKFEAGKMKKIAFNFDKAGEKIADGNYVILAKDGENYYAVSTEANGTSLRRDRVQLNDYNGENSYITDNQNIIWTVTQVAGGYAINNGENYFSGAKNTVPMVTSDNASTLTANQNNDGTWQVTADCGDDGTRYLAMNGTYGFGFYQSGSDIYFVPATYLALASWTMDDIEDLEYNDTSLHEQAVTTDATSVAVAAYTSDEYTTECDWIVVDYDAANAKFQYTATVNTTDAARTAYIKITATNAQGDKDYYTTITQKKQSASGKTEYTATATFGTNNINKDSYTSFTDSQSNAWTGSVTGTTSFTNNAAYLQIGSKKNPATAVTFTSASFAGATIKSVTVNCECMSNTGPTVTITAGSTTMLKATSLVKGTFTDHKTTSDSVDMGSSDELVISFASSASAGIAISSITVVYEK